MGYISGRGYEALFKTIKINMLKSQNFGNLGIYSTNLAFSYVGYTGQYLANYANFGYNPFQYEDRGQKFGIAAFKSLFYGLAINR